MPRPVRGGLADRPVGQPWRLDIRGKHFCADFGLAPGIDVPWLFRLLLDTFQNSRYLGSFLSSLVTHAFLFCSLIVGVKLSRAREQAVLRIQ